MRVTDRYISYEQFFEKTSDYEELYQLFKERFTEEIKVHSPELLHLALLVDEESHFERRIDYALPLPKETKTEEEEIEET